MIKIRVSETGSVSGQAWETIGYEGDKQSRILHTIFNKPVIIADDNFTAGYQIKSKILQKVESIDLDKDNNIIIPREFMSVSQRLWFQFYIKSGDFYVMKSDPFHLNIESSLGEDAEVILKPGANNFISVDTIEDRDNIPRSQLADGKVVRVNNVNGKPTYYSWDNDNAVWIIEVFGVGTITMNGVEGLVDALSWHGIGEEN